MRYLQVVVALIIVSASIVGCNILEDRSKCVDSVEHNLILHFSNVNDDGEDVFDKTIDIIDLFLFDKNDVHIKRIAISEAELRANQSLALKLEPGTYRIVCWANAKENALFTMDEGDVVSSGYIYKSIPTNNILEDGNHLYYAPYNNMTSQNFTLTRGKTEEVDVIFRSAHIKMEFTVKGYAEKYNSSSNPHIELTNLHPKYDFHMQTIETQAVSYIKQTVGATRSEDVTYSKFNTPRFKNENNIEINVRESPNSGIIKSFNLSKLLQNQGINVETANEITLYFEIVFSGTDISVSVDSWESGTLIPDLT